MSIMRPFSSMAAEQAAPPIKEDLNSFAKSELERAFNEALDGGIEGFLLTASSPNGEKIHRNGYCERALKASCGPLPPKAPRDRLALSKAEMPKPCRRAASGLGRLAQALCSEGLALSEISGRLMDDSSIGFSRESIGKLVAKLAREAEEFRSRDLPECVVAFADGAYVPLKGSCGGASSVSRECIEAAIGITKDGRRQVLDFRAVPQEGAGNWSDSLGSLKRRGIGSPKPFAADGLQGMPEAIAASFPEAGHRLCLVHARRNASQAVRIRDRKEIMGDFKAVYSKGSREECDEAFADFASKWSKPYPKLMPSLVERQGSMFRFCEFPKPMWRAIYTSNAAESLNATAKRKTRARIQYNSEDSALIALAKACGDCSRNAGPARLMPEPSEEEKQSMGFEI